MVFILRFSIRHPQTPGSVDHIAGTIQCLQRRILHSPTWGILAQPPLSRLWQQGGGNRVAALTFSTHISTRSFYFQLSARHYLQLGLVSLSRYFADSLSPEHKPSGILQGVVARLKRVGEGNCGFNCFLYRLLNNWLVFGPVPFSFHLGYLVPPGPELLGGWVEWTITLVYIPLYEHVSSSFLLSAINPHSVSKRWPLWPAVVCSPVLYLLGFMLYLLSYYHLVGFGDKHMNVFSLPCLTKSLLHYIFIVLNWILKEWS